MVAFRRVGCAHHCPLSTRLVGTAHPTKLVGTAHPTFRRRRWRRVKRSTRAGETKKAAAGWVARRRLENQTVLVLLLRHANAATEGLGRGDFNLLAGQQRVDRV